MADFTRNFLTQGPPPGGTGGGGASGDDITTGRAYRVAFREITSAIDDAANKGDSHSKEIIDQLKALRAQLKADAEKYPTTKLGSTPPEVYKEFVDVLKTIKAILQQRSGEAPDTHETSGHGRADRVDHSKPKHAGGTHQQRHGSELGRGAAVIGADMIAPGLGVVVKGIQENSAVIKDAYHTIRDLPRELREGYKATADVIKGIHNFLSPNHPHSVTKAIEKIAGGGSLIADLLAGGAILYAIKKFQDKAVENLPNKGGKLIDDLNKLTPEQFFGPGGPPGGYKKGYVPSTPAAPNPLNPTSTGPASYGPNTPASSLSPMSAPGTGAPAITTTPTPTPSIPLSRNRPSITTTPTPTPSIPLPSNRPSIPSGSTPSTQPTPSRDRRKGAATKEPTPRWPGQVGGLGGVGPMAQDYAEDGPNSGWAIQLTPFAKGGIVDRPTIGLLGEDGPEMIVPLKDAGLAALKGLQEIGGPEGLLKSGFEQLQGLGSNILGAVNSGFNTGLGGKNKDIVVQLMRKQTDLLDGILSALTGEGGGLTRGLTRGIQLASLSTGGGLTGGGVGLGGSGFPGGQGGFPGSGFGAGNPLKSPPYSLPGGRLPGGGFGPGSLGGGFGGRGGGGGGRRGGGSGRRSSSSSSPGGTPDTPTITSTTPTGPAYQGLAPPGTGPLGGLSISAFTPGGGSFSNLPTTKTIPNPQFAPGSDIRPDPGLFGPPTQTQGPFDTSKATTATTRQNQSPNIDPGMFGPPTNVGGLSSLGGGTSGNGDIGGRGSTPTNEKGTAGVAAIVAAEWRKVGMSEAGIAGVLANIKEESSFDPNLRHPDQPKFSGEAHFAHGLYQEGGDEWNNYEKWLHGRDWKDPKLQSQFAAENLKKNYPKVWEKMNKGSNTEAAEAYVRGYLKPKQQYQDSRVAGFQRRGVPNVSSYTSSKATDPIISAPGARPGGATQTPIPTTPGSAQAPVSTVSSSSGGTLIVFKGKDGQIDAKSMEQIAAGRGQKVQYFEHTEAGKAAQWVKDNPGSYDVIGFSAGANHSTLKEFFDKTPRKPGQLDTAGRSDRSPAFARPPGVLGVDIADHKTGQQQLAASSAKQIATRSLTPVNAPTGADAKIGVGTGISANQSLDFWKARNQVGARLDGVRKDELHVTAEAVRMFERDHPGLGVRILGPGGGTRAPGSDKGNHSHGNALDLMIYDKATGKLYADMPGGKNRAENLASANKVGIGESAPLYQELANNARIANEKFYPGSPIRYGGYFDQGGRGDVQHIDKTSNSAALGDWPTGYSKSQLEYLGMDPKLNKGVGSPQDIARRVAAEYPPGGVLAGNQPTPDTPGATPALPQRSPGDILKDLVPGGTGDTAGPAATTTTTRSLTPTPTTTERRTSHAHHKGFDTTDPVTSLTPTGGDTGSYAPEFKSTVLRPEFTKGTMTPYERHLDRTLRKDQAERDANDAEANRQTPLPRERPVQAKQDTLDTTDSPVDANPIGASPAKADTQDKPQHTPKHHQRHPSKTSRRVASHTHQPHNVQSHNHGKHHAIHHPGNRNRHTSSRHTNHPNHHTIHQHPTHHSRHPTHSQPHHVRHPNRGHAPMHHDDMNIGNHPTATAMHEDIGNLHRLASDLQHQPRSASSSGRLASASIHHETPDVKSANGDIAALLDSGTRYLS